MKKLVGVLNYYSSLFSSTKPSWEDVDSALRFIETKVDKNMNDYLDSSFSDEEIKRAVFDIGPSKAPGPDGFPSSFYHHAWEFIDTDIYKAAKRVLNDGAGMDDWNETTITLIPKIKKPENSQRLQTN